LRVVVALPTQKDFFFRAFPGESQKPLRPTVKKVVIRATPTDQ
jgi:hypothetical protein